MIQVFKTTVPQYKDYNTEHLKTASGCPQQTWCCHVQVGRTPTPPRAPQGMPASRALGQLSSWPAPVPDLRTICGRGWPRHSEALLSPLCGFGKSSGTSPQWVCVPRLAHRPQCFSPKYNGQGHPLKPPHPAAQVGSPPAASHSPQLHRVVEGSEMLTALPERLLPTSCGCARPGASFFSWQHLCAPSSARCLEAPHKACASSGPHCWAPRHEGTDTPASGL